MEWVAAAIVLLASLAGIALTLLTLPGIWLTLLVALLCWAWQPQMFDPWTMLTAFILGVMAELVEFAASAVGAAKGGGTRSGAIGSVAGSLVGALGGSVFIPIPIVGTIAGGVIGAAAGAVIGERGFAKRSWSESARVGHGAAIGRLVATVVKTGFAAAIGVILSTAAFMA